MANKRTRLDVLRRLFENNSYDNQVDILNDLKNEGFMVAQPTLSRDMRQLKVSRIYNTGRQCMCFRMKRSLIT